MTAAPALAEVVQGRRGLPTARVAAESGAVVHLHSLYDPIGEAARQVPPPCGARTLVFLGCGLGYHLGPTLAANPQARRVLLVERHPELAAHAARAAAAAAPDVRLEVVTPSEGAEPSPPEDLEAASLQVVPHPPSLQAHPLWYGRWQAWVAVAGLPARTPERAPRADRKLTVLVLTGDYYCQAEAVHGLEALGHRVLQLPYRRDEARSPDAFRRVLVDEAPDLVLSVNLRGLIHPESMSLLLRRLGIPLALWFVDSPEFILEEAALPPRDVCRVFLWDRAYEPGVRALGHAPSWLPLAADEALLPAARPDPRFEAALSFVGNTLLTGFLERLAVQLPRTEAMTQLREQAVAAVVEGRGRQLDVLDALVARHAHLLPPGRARLYFRAAVLHGATSAYRIDLLGRLLPLGVRFFGDPEGWRRALGPGARVHPDVSYAREVPAVYASSGISFSATSLQMPRAVNQRCFDVPLFGGFLLSDRQGDLADLFAEDEVATYDGPGDVADRAREYLAAPALRREIAARARTRVLGEHTYRHRMQQLLDGVFGSAPRRAP